MRAALGLPTLEDLFLGRATAASSTAAAAPDLQQYRRALYQDQLDQQLQELQMRANLATQLDDFGDLRRNLLLSGHLRAQRPATAAEEAHLLRQAALVPPAAAAAPGSVHLQQAVAEAQAAQLRYQEQIQRQQEQDQVKRRQEELLILQVRQAMQESSEVNRNSAAHQATSPSLSPHPVLSPLQALLMHTEARDMDVPTLPLTTATKRRSASAESESAVGVRPRKKSRKPTVVPRLEALSDYIQDTAGLADGSFHWGSLYDLIQAADEEDPGFAGADVLTTLKTIEWPDSDDESTKPKAARRLAGLVTPEIPAESFVSPVFESYFPALPEEPLYIEPEEMEEATKAVEGEEGKTADGTDDKAVELETENMGDTVDNRLRYPYPIDMWYPSYSGRCRERHQAGETSDEDEMDIGKEDLQLAKSTNFRAYGKKIRDRLSKSVQPGLVEKVPHCRLHRLRSKYETVTELLFCVQVAESYPNDMLVNCSKCGTWRHATCGGHYKPVTVKECCQEAFVALCENCHAEEKYLKENPRGRYFMERQRMEHIRRGLATSAVLRQMAFVKHGGTSKWPLGSVSTSHIESHIRSVQGRHDKAEKQWLDLSGRLSKRFGYRLKERSKARTKELERLLVCVEDAEGHTDRHNMLLFLTRDTARVHPVGFEKPTRNIFDPEESELSESDAQAKTDDDSSSAATATLCARQGCVQKHRFDSLFCSDACGVSVLESDLLKSFHESSILHPSVLRFSY